ncbi:hypothetical protein NPIL_685401, partial [Nephila pilipes]
KNVKTGKGPLTVIGLIKLDRVLRKLDRVRLGRPKLRQTRSALVEAEMETLASESAVGTSSAGDGGRAWAYRHPRYATFFIEFLISIHINYSVAMNFYRWIP